MFRIIRCGEAWSLVIVVTPKDAKPDTVGARFYLWASWQMGDYMPEVFREISLDEVINYFGGMADGLGFGEIPRESFASLEEVAQFIEKKRNGWGRKRLEELARKRGLSVEQMCREDEEWLRKHSQDSRKA